MTKQGKETRREERVRTGTKDLMGRVAISSCVREGHFEGRITDKQRNTHTTGGREGGYHECCKL
jgi:hypothetical protein